MGVGRHRNRRFVSAVVGITGLALGRTVAPIGLAAVRTAVVAPVPAVVTVSDLALARTIVPVLFTVIRDADGGTVDTVVGSGNFTFGRTVVPVFFAVIGNVHAFPDMAVVGVGHLADRGTGRGIIFGAAVRPFVNPGRTDAVGILSAAAVPGHRTRIRTVGRSILVFRLADAAFVSAAAGSAGTVLFGRTGNQSRVAFAGSIHFVAAFADADLSGGTGDKVGQAFASQPVGGVIGTNAVNGLYGVAVQFGISLVLALLAGVNCIILNIFTKAGVAAVFGAEETDGGGLKGFVGLFKLKGGLRFGCVCVCKCR